MRTLDFGIRALALAALLSPAGCGSGDQPPGEPATPRGQPSEPAGACNAVTQSFDVPSALHQTDCSPLPDSSKPPSGGDHYGTWAAFQSYAFPIPHGFLIHSMEHGAVIVYYNCPSGCANEVAEVQSFLDSQPEDPLCLGQSTLRRAVLTPDPTLDVRWAMSAWGETLRADCFDSRAFGSFYQAHYGHGPEQLCNAGAAFNAPPCE
ncbi:MAG TPA: DUF3105 domain-containing protein [Polyangiaceae bacterium]|nr:DUF3105 domain-containing protein [Polyangiaceae bacterium]